MVGMLSLTKEKVQFFAPRLSYQQPKFIQRQYSTVSTTYFYFSLVNCLIPQTRLYHRFRLDLLGKVLPSRGVD